MQITVEGIFLLVTLLTESMLVCMGALRALVGLYPSFLLPASDKPFGLSTSAGRANILIFFGLYHVCCFLYVRADDFRAAPWHTASISITGPFFLIFFGFIAVYAFVAPYYLLARVSHVPAALYHQLVRIA